MYMYSQWQAKCVHQGFAANSYQTENLVESWDSHTITVT